MPGFGSRTRNAFTKFDVADGYLLVVALAKTTAELLAFFIHQEDAECIVVDNGSDSHRDLGQEFVQVEDRAELL